MSCHTRRCCRAASTASALCALLIAAAGPAVAGENGGARRAPPAGPAPQLVTDRPDFTESASAVPPWRVQTELGVELDLAEEGHALALPALLARVGVVDGVELRVGVPGVVVAWPDGDADASAGELELGAKWVWDLGQGAAAGLLPFVRLPVEGEAYDASGVSLGLTFVWSTELSDRLALGGNLGLTVTGLGAEAVDVDHELVASLALGIGLTERLGTFVESYVDFVGDDVLPVVDTGLTYLVTRRVQLDLYVGLRLDDPVGGYLGSGAAILW